MNALERLAETFAAFVTQARDIWLGGGWAMVAIAVVAVVMFGVGVHVMLRFLAMRFTAVPETRWRRWIDHPDERRGRIGRLLDQATAGNDPDETAARFEQLEATETAPFERDLTVMKVCVGAAPLVGLLGTVTGMLATFDALSTGAGGDKTMSLVAAGISEALITTETGLIVALPGLFFQYQLTRSFERYKAFLAHVESVVTQTLYRRRTPQRPARDDRRSDVAQRILARLQQVEGGRSGSPAPVEARSSSTSEPAPSVSAGAPA